MKTKLLTIGLAIKTMLVITSALILSCCNGSLSQTPDEDTTMLWPAADSTGLWGFINEKGEMVIPAKYDRTYGFSRGVAKVIIDEDGQPMPAYVGYQANLIGSKQAFINTKGKIVYTLPDNLVFIDHYFYYGCCRFGDEHIQGMIDSKFNYIITFDTKNNGIRLGVMTKDGLASSAVGYFDKSGHVVISRYINGLDGEMYYFLYDFCDGVAVVNKWWYDNAGSYNRYGAINTKGELVIDTIYRSLQSVGNGRLLYKLDNGDSDCWGLMDTQGNIITKPFLNDNIFFYGDGGLMPVKGDGGYGYIDINGDLQIPYQYIAATPFCEGKAWVLISDGYWQLINLKKEVLLTLDSGWDMPYTIFPANGAHNGLCLIRNDKEQSRYRYTYSYINMQGKVVYSWVVDESSLHSGAPEIHNQPESSEEDRMLQMFEGTKYYPLASQCVQRKRERTTATDK